MFETLSEKQKSIVLNTGKFVVKACPGSGKTYSVAARIRYLLENWKEPYKGIAAISFTNTAWEEIHDKLINKFNLKRKIAFPHFLGTIDSFLNKYIFLPHGHLVMECNTRPELVGAPHGIWSGRYFSDSFFDLLTYDVDGNIITLEPRKMPKNWQSNKRIINSKQTYTKKGYATQSDANYFSLKVLEDYPKIAKLIADRFPVFIIDEAQDTSEIQMRIIDAIINQGLNDISLIGDPDQAIFEWNNARPDLFNSKYELWSENSILLNENRRSSQTICDFTFPLSSLDEKSEAVNEKVKDIGYLPEIISYSDLTVQSTINKFIEKCKSYNIDITKKNVAVLFRSKAFVSSLFSNRKQENYWTVDNIYTKDFALGKYLYDNGEVKKGIKLIESACFKVQNNRSHFSAKQLNEIIRKIGFVEYKNLIHNIIDLLPETTVTISEWIKKANTSFKNLGINYTLSINKKFNDYSFDDIFANTIENNLPYHIGTVHSVKGETYDAVLLFLKNKGAVGSHYKTLLKNNISINENEELRIVYVGLTRPRKFLTLAVIEDAKGENIEQWTTKLNNKKT